MQYHIILYNTKSISYHIISRCIWELYTLFAFAAKLEIAMERIEIILVGKPADQSTTDTTVATSTSSTATADPQHNLEKIHADVGVSVEDLIEKLENFSLNNAKCFDPNEENKLRSLIIAVGQDKFEKNVRSIGAILKQNNESKKKNSLKNVLDSLLPV